MKINEIIQWTLILLLLVVCMSNYYWYKSVPESKMNKRISEIENKLEIFEKEGIEFSSRAEMYHDMIVNGEYPDDYIKGKKEKWSTIVDELIAGGKVSGQRVVDTGTIRVLKKRQRKLKK